ncbi:MAG: tetratricopeptide repeat protein, partial [Verrucomicrobiota bacterium]
VYEKVIAGHPEALEVREKLAAIFAALEDSEMVLATLLELEKINPHRQETQRRVAQIYLHRKQYSEAVDHYLKAFQIAKGSPQEYLNVAELLRFERRADEAVEMLKRARFHYPEEVELLIELAVSNIAADQFGIAFTLFQESENVAESLRPDLLDGMFYFSFGAAAERTKRYDEAESLFRKSISLTGEDVFPKVRARPFNYLGYMFLEQDKNFEEAGELIQEANDLVPNDASYVDSLGWYYFKVEEYPQALRALLRAETLLTKELESDPVIFDHIAQAYFQLGHRKEALAYIGKAIARDPDNEEYQSRKTSFEETAPPQKVPLDFLDAPQMDSSSGDGESTAPAGDEQEIPEVPNTP